MTVFPESLRGPREARSGTLTRGEDDQTITVETGDGSAFKNPI